MAKTTIGQKVRSRRSELSVTRERLASDIGVSVSTLARLENSNHVPRVGTLTALAKRLSLGLDDLLG
ncbi:helix-turn-helix transcriptional regulator [Prescottella equi]|uniref:helix-turn-helix transcriptional regulator n=1 Tax=Rhodococcus hoagii TaxID=43767 RepID=UPI0009C0D410